MDDQIQTGDIIQITNKEHNWFPCLLIVDEVKSWGCTAYALIPNPQSSTGQAFNRIKAEDYEKVGTAHIVNSDEEQE